MQASALIGLQELLAGDLAKVFTYRDVQFRAVVEDEDGEELHERKYRTGGRFDSVLAVDPSVTAFTDASVGDQLPSSGENVIHLDSGEKYSVAKIDFAAESHVAFLHCRKNGRPKRKQVLHESGSPVAHADGSIVEPEEND